MSEVYIIAPLMDDGSLPTEFDVYDERFFVSEEEASVVLSEDFPPSMRNKHAVYTVNFDVRCVFGEEPEPVDEITAAVTEAVVAEVNWEEDFLARHNNTPSEVASDYYFYVNEDDEMFAFVPTEYWNKLGKLLSVDNVVPESILPHGFEPDEDGWYTYASDLQRGRLALSTVGFEEADLGL